MSKKKDLEVKIKYLQAQLISAQEDLSDEVQKSTGCEICGKPSTHGLRWDGVQTEFFCEKHSYEDRVGY